MLGRSKMNVLLSIGTSFLLGVGAGLLIKGNDWTNFLTSYIPALATLVAAFYGAKFAFEFQNNKELVIEKKHNVAAANTAIFTFSRMANLLFEYRREFINPVRENKAYFIELRPTLNFEKEFIELNIQPLYFLLETEYRNLLSEVAIETERYRVTIDVINLRSKIHIEELQPLLEKAGFESGKEKILSSDELEQILGNRLFHTIKESTENVIYHVDSTIKSMEELSKKIKTSMNNIYPNETIISFTLPKE
jgi:hypothetical protein